MLVMFSSFPCFSPYHRGLTVNSRIPHQSCSGWVQPMRSTGGRVRKMEKPGYLASAFLFLMVSAVYILWLWLSIYFQFCCVIPAPDQITPSPPAVPPLFIFPWSALYLKGTQPCILCFPDSHISWLPVFPQWERHWRQIKGNEWGKGEGISSFPMVWVAFLFYGSSTRG